MQPGQNSYRARLMLCQDAEIDANNLVNIRGGGINGVGAVHPKAAIVDQKLFIWGTTDAFFSGQRRLSVKVIGPDGSVVDEGAVQQGPLAPNA